MKILKVALVLTMLVGAGTFIGLFAFKLLFDHELQVLVDESRGSSFEMDFLNYETVSLFESGVALHGIRASGVVQIQSDYIQPRQFELSIDQLRLSLRSFSARSLSVSIESLGAGVIGGRILGQGQLVEHRLESVTELVLRTELLLEGLPYSWRAQVFDRAQAIKVWVFEGRPISNVETHGQALVVVDDEAMPVRFHSVTNAKGLVHLEGNVDDLRPIAEAIEPKFTDADLEIAAKNLLKTPQLMSIRNKAELQAIGLENRDPEIPYDVPRHIYWSYWLTQAFGPEFTREVTDAHEIGDTSSTHANTAMDHSHNELGIEYATRQFTEAEVEKLIFEDPRVVRVKVGER